MMKNAWRGLSSLIPNRHVEDPDDVLEQLEAEELVDSAAAREEAAPKAPEVPARARRRRVGVVAEEEEGGQRAPAMPPKPNVTPLTIDLEPAEEPEAAPDDDDRTAVGGGAGRARGVASRDVQAEQPVGPGPRSVPVEDQADEQAAATVSRRAPTDGWDTHEEDVRHIPITDIHINQNQPRRQFDEAEMAELVRSIAHHGILQPLVVRRLEAAVGSERAGFELVAGERRLRAAKQLGWEKVPCVVRRDVRSGAAQLELALIENIQRQDLNPIEEAMAYRQLNEEYGMTHEEIGERVGKSRVGITNTIRILQLPDEIQRGLVDGKVTIGHAKAILMIPDEEKQVRFYRHLVEEGLTVRKAETRARRIQRAMHVDDPMREKRKGRSAYEMKYSGLLEDRYGYDAKVRFNHQRNRFEIVFKCYSKEEADELIGRLMGAVSLPTEQRVDNDVLEEEDE